MKTTVSIVETTDRVTGVNHSIDLLDINPVKNRRVLIKPNFNTADPTPGSTHNDTLAALIDKLWDMGAESVSLGERSYPLTRDVVEKKGILSILKEKQVKFIDFDTLPEKDWVEFKPGQSHWKNGFRIARPILDAECLVSTCCLKTHQFGGVFTLSLKLHVGVLPTFRHGFSYMEELHSSFYQQELIAEINEPFSPDIVVLDGIEAFVEGGPATGKRVKSNIFLAATDRIAIDAVSLAILKHHGTTPEIMTKPIFEQRQIKRAVQLGIGIDSASKITLVPDKGAATDDIQSFRHILDQG